MKLKIRPDDASMLQMNDWLAELREDDRPEPPAASRVEAANGSSPPQAEVATGAAWPQAHAEAVTGGSWPQTHTGPAAPPILAEAARPAYRTALAEAAVPTYGAVPAEAASFAPPALPADVAQTETQAEVQTQAEIQAEVPTQAHAEAPHADTTVRSVIGDQLRMPIMWCEMGSCVSWHADPAALGEADNRARAIEAGWRIDGFGRLACPRCQQADPTFRVSGPVVPWDRYTAMARTARIVAGR